MALPAVVGGQPLPAPVLDTTEEEDPDIMEDISLEEANLTTEPKDIQLYQQTYAMMAHILRSVRIQPGYQLIVVGGAAVSMYLPAQQQEDLLIQTHDWDVRLVMLDQTRVRDTAYLHAANQYRLQLINGITDTLNQACWNLLQHPELPITQWLEANLHPWVTQRLDAGLRPYFFQTLLGSKNEQINSVPWPDRLKLSDLLTIKCQIKSYGIHSLLDNILFYPDRPAWNYYYFLNSRMSTDRSPIPFISYNGINYATIGYILLDTCKMINYYNDKITALAEAHEHDIAAAVKKQRYRAKFDAVAQTLDNLLTRHICYLPVAVGQVLQTIPKPLATTLQKLGSNLGRYYQKGCSVSYRQTQFCQEPANSNRIECVKTLPEFNLFMVNLARALAGPELSRCLIDNR